MNGPTVRRSHGRAAITGGTAVNAPDAASALCRCVAAARMANDKDRRMTRRSDDKVESRFGKGEGQPGERARGRQCERRQPTWRRRSPPEYKLGQRQWI